VTEILREMNGQIQEARSGVNWGGIWVGGVASSVEKK